jgi:hypothetical protein
MDGIIFCETIPGDEANSLSKATLIDMKDSYINTLFKEYPNSEATKTIAKMYDLDMPEGYIPEEYKLYSCYPNPFNPSTTISFDLPEISEVCIDIYNIRGQIVKQVVNRRFQVGQHEVVVDASDLSSGIYIYKLTSDNYTAVERMTLLK